MKRKKFLSILGIAGLGTSMGGFASEKYSSLIIENTPFFKLSLAQWSLHIAIQSGKMSPYDFGKFAKKHGFGGLEYVNTLYKDVMKSKEKSKFGIFAPRSALSPITLKTNNEPSMAPIISAAK